jgi:hypothetical protein
LIAETIERAGITREQAAAELGGMSKQYLSNILTGYREITPYLIESRFGPWIERHAFATRDDLYIAIGMIPPSIRITPDAFRILRAAVDMARQAGQN